MFFKRGLWTVVFVAVLATSTGVSADTVLLKNGDRLSGEVAVMEKGKLKLKTSYAGVIKIDWAEVDSVDSDSVMKVFRRQAEASDGVVAVKEEDVSSIGGSESSTSEVAAINSKPKDYKFSGSVRAGWNKAEGNTRKENVSASFDLAYEIGKNRFKGRGDHYWGSSKGQRSDYNWLLSAGYDRFIDQKFYVTGTGQIQHDQFQDLTQRSVIGAAPGYQFFDSEELVLSVEAGPAYVWEDYTTRDSREFAAARWAVDFKWWAFPKRLKLFHNQMGLMSVKDTENWLWQSRSGVMFPIVERFFGSFQYNYDWTNDPVPGKEQDDSRIMFNLGYSFDDLPWMEE